MLLYCFSALSTLDAGFYHYRVIFLYAVMEQTKSKVCLKQGWADLDTVSELPQTEQSAEMCENP